MARGQVRIIGGEWRGRKLLVPNIPDLRPTPDRVRETLFNWLAPLINGAYCLDAFAGTGILGFEALSRGALQVVMVDQSPIVTKCLIEESQLLKTESRIEIYCAKLPEQLKKSMKPFNIVFLDPPSQANLLLPCCFYLEENQLLAHDAFIYLESNRAIEPQELPPNWELVKSKKAGDVHYHLARRD